MRKLAWIFGMVWMGLWACDPKDDPTPKSPEQGVKKAIVDTMREWYFWNGRIPTTIDLNNFSSNEELLDGIIFKPLDRFSYLTTQEAFQNSFVGRNAGHGFGCWG